MSEEMLALVDEFENSWPLEAFEGALELKGRRMDLQGIRVLKKGTQDGQSGSCFGDCDDDDDEAEWVGTFLYGCNKIMEKFNIRK